MAQISTTNSMLDLEPVMQLGLHQKTSPYSFLVDAFTIGYISTRGIVLHCIPLHQERLIVVESNIVQILKVASSFDGEFIASLNQTVDNQIQVQIFHISTLKMLQMIPLSQKMEIPDEMYFAHQSKILLLVYKQNARVITVAWQRGNADDCLNVMDEPRLIKMCPYSQSTITTINQSNQIRFWRLFDQELRPFAPTRMKQMINDLPNYVSILYLGGGIVACVIQNGEILIFQPPKFIGVIKIPVSYSAEEKEDLDPNQHIQLRSIITQATNRGEFIVLATKKGQIILLEVNVDIQSYLQRYKAQNLVEIETQKAQGDYFTSEISDDLDSLDALMDLLPKGTIDVFKQQVSLYPFKVICSTQVSHEEDERIDICSLHLHLDLCLVETKSQLYIWSISGQRVFYNGVTIISEPEMKDFTSNLSTIVPQLEAEKILGMKQLQQKIIDEQQDMVINTVMNQQFQELSIDVSTVRTIMNYTDLYLLMDEQKQFLDFNELDDYFWDNGSIAKDTDNGDNSLQLDILQLKAHALNQLTPPITYNMLIQGLSFKNLSPQPLVSYLYGPRLSLRNNYCVPQSFRIGSPIFISNIETICMSQNIIILKSADMLYGLKIPSLQVFASREFKNVRQIEISPDERVFYALVFDSIAICSILEKQFKIICQANFKGVSSMKLSNSGGYIALTTEYNNKFYCQIFSTVNFRLIIEIQAHSTRIISVSFGVGDYCIFTNSEDGIIYGHTITGERFFEQATRGIPLYSTLALLSNQYTDTADQYEEQTERPSKSQNKNSLTKQNDMKNVVTYESFTFSGIDEQNVYYELSSQHQTHQINLEPDQKISCVLPVPCFSTNWNNRQVKLFGAINTEDEISAIEKESQTATSAVFSKALGDYFDKHALSKNLKMQEEPLVLGCQNIFDERKQYFDSDSRSSSMRSGDQLGEVNYKFLLTAVDDGYLICYNWPIRDNKQLFKIKLHNEKISYMKIVYSSFLITVSSNQIIVSNLRFFLSQEGIFGLNIRNKDLAKMKRTIGKQTMQLKMPITRLYNNLYQDILIRNVDISASFDGLLIQMINNMKDMWTFADFRMNLFKENVRDKKNQIQKGINTINQRKQFEIQLIKDKHTVIDEETDVLIKQETNHHNDISQQIQSLYADDIQKYRQSNDLIQKQILQFNFDQKAKMKEAEKQRYEILQLTKQTIQIREIEKQNQLDHLDELLDQNEKQMNEELKQLAEEREIIKQQLISSRQTTVNRELDSINMLKAWENIQQRKVIQMNVQISEIKSEMDIGLKNLKDIDEEGKTVSQQIEIDVKILKEKDNDIKNRENIVFRLKEEISELSKYQTVLNEQISGIKREIGPRDNLICDMKLRSEDLGRKLEQTTKTWDDIQDLTKTEQQLVLQSTSQAQKLQSLENATKRQHQIIKHQFSNIVIELPDINWFKCILNLWLQYQKFLKVLEARPQFKKTDDGNFSDVTKEITQQKSVLDDKLEILYSGLHQENQKFVNIQQFSLDENSALLEESHRLKIENLDLTEKLSKINSMIQALKVQEVTNQMHKETHTVGRTESLMRTMNARFGQNNPRSLSVLSNTLQAERKEVQNLMRSIQKVPQILKQPIQDIDDDEI